jgi:hypothetical protein
MTVERVAVGDGQAMRSVELELHAEFPLVPIGQVRILVECLWSHFDGAAVREFVPLLVRKQAKEELLDLLGRAEATTPPAGLPPPPS